MPKFDPSKVPNMGPRKYKFEYKTIPEGWYLAEIAEAKQEFETSGVEVWICHWMIIDGPHKDVAVKDWMRWGDDGEKSESNMARCKHICACIGAINPNTKGEVDVQPVHVQGGVAAIKIYHTQKGDKIYCNVSYDGVRALTPEEAKRVGFEPATAVLPDGEIPF